MKILILEDEVVLLDKYRKYLDSEFESIFTCTTVEEAKKLHEEHSFHVVLIDYNLPDGNGLDLIKDYPDPFDAPVSVMITAYSKEKVAIESLNLGVFKYLEKPIDKEKLLKIVSMAKSEAERREQVGELSHRFIISPAAEKKLSEDYTITKRELEVIRHIIIHGKNNNVALILNIGQGTVRNHLSNIFQKLHINNKDELKERVMEFNSEGMR